LVEPASATALAVAVGLVDWSGSGRDIGVVVTGGNVDTPVIRSLLADIETTVGPPT
jgi:threonine dehydratase